MKKLISSKVFSESKFYIGFVIFGWILLLFLNWLWIVYFKFYNVPLLAIDGLAITNTLVSFFVIRKVPLAASLLTGMSILITLLGFILLRGFLKG